MAAAILPFVGRPTLDARENLRAFIIHAQKNRFFTADDGVNWADNSWDLRPFYKKAASNPPGLVAHFTTMETTRRGNRAKDAIDMSAPFIDTAKALVTEYLRTTGDNAVSKIVATVRILEKAFRDLGLVPDICDLTPGVLDRAQEIILENFSDAITYGKILERVVNDYLAPACLTSVRISWRTAILRQEVVRNDRVNEDGVRGNVEKLPDVQIIFDLSGVFTSSQYIPDIIITSWLAFAMFSPSRVNEILGLPVACETEMDGIYGLSWTPLKGGMRNTVFAASEEMGNVAKEAIARLKPLGEKSREAHRWYEKNPDQLFLPSGFEHLRGQPITLWEAAQILGRTIPLQQGSAPRNALRRCGTTKDLSRGQETTGRFLNLYEFDSLQDFVLASLPDSFPYINPREKVLGSEALFCLPDQIMRGAAENQPYLPTYLTDNQVSHELGSKPSGETIFSRNNLVDRDTGVPWKLATHQPRHLLGTLAQSKHLSAALHAFWAGRKSIRQNRWYEHVPQEAVIEAFRSIDEALVEQVPVYGPLREKVFERMHKEAISYEAALKLELGSTIMTRYGLCRHNYSLMPCPKDKNCIGCGENTFIKGDARHLIEAQSQHELSSRACERAQAAVDGGKRGAERYLEIHLEKKLRWSLAVQLLTDPMIKDGTLITLPPPKHSQAKAGLAIAKRETNLGDVDVDDDFKLETQLFGGADQAGFF